MDKVSHFLTNLRLQLQKKFSHFSLLFSILSSILSWNMCKSRRKLWAQKFTPMRSEFYKLFFSISFYGQFRKLCHISKPTLLKHFFSKLEFLFSVLDSMVSIKTSVNCVTNWKMQNKNTKTDLVMTK